MDLEIRTFKNKKEEVIEGIFIGNKLICSLSGFAQIRRGLIAHARELGDRLGWLYVVLILLAKPIGKDKGTLELSLKVLSQLMGKSLSQISRDLNGLAKHKNRYIVYQKAKGRYSRLAKIIIPKYPVDKSVNNLFDLCRNGEVNCIDAEVNSDTATKNAKVHCINAEVEVDNHNKIRDLSLPDNRLITRTNKSLITVEDKICGRLLFVISIRQLNDLNIDINPESLRGILKEYCLLREKRGWCVDPELCYPQVVDVFNRMAGYKISSPLAYIKTSLENFLNEHAEEISKKVKMRRERLVKNP